MMMMNSGPSERPCSSHMGSLGRLAAVATLLGLMSPLNVPHAFAHTILDFEAPLPGIAPVVSAPQGAPVAAENRVTTEFLDLGIRMDRVAVVAMYTATPSGANGIGGIGDDSTVDYGAPMTFVFESSGRP